MKRREQLSTYYLYQYTVIFYNKHTFVNCLKKMRLKALKHLVIPGAWGHLHTYLYALFISTHTYGPQTISVRIKGRPT